MAKGPCEREASKAVEKKLSRLLGVSMTVVITDNRRSMISVKKGKHGYAVRLHHMFLEADESILRSLAEYISGNLDLVRARLQAFIRSREGMVRKPSRPNRKRATRVMPQGRYFDLQEAFDRLNRQYFRDQVDSAITWGSRRRPGKKSVRLGSFSGKTNIIRINPVLDRAHVPSCVIEEVIHHEMLHRHLGEEKRNGRRLHHHRRFKEMEREFTHRREARRWLNENLHRLLGR